MSAGADRPRVLLLWPGGLLAPGGNFGVPQLLGLARILELDAEAQVDVVDLDLERALGPVDLGRIAAARYDLVAISCYSSFDYLVVVALAERLRALLPKAWFVTGGYHASARPKDFLFDGTPFDYVVVGDGERPLLGLVQDLDRGIRPLDRIRGPDSTPDPSELVPYRWELLDRYRPVARRVASQAEIYLSRGCPYDCAFCMERAKRDTSWRAMEPETAVEELHRLDRFLDLSSWTVFVADALFGMKRSWRRVFLEELARRPLRAIRVWLLIRIDLIEREDFELMARANVSPGFGLESGDPDQLRRIRKAGKLEGYLDKMLTIAEWARERDVPFGANIIVGHPGETEASMRRSAAYMRRLFLGDSGTHGFLSVDPFRLYPGSPIDESRAAWEEDTGMQIHRYPWWFDGDQDFLAEWVAPSRELPFRRSLELRHELFSPIVSEIPNRFAYEGPARDYFMRAVNEQVELVQPERRLRTLGLHQLWSRLVGTDRAPPLATDAPLVQAAEHARRNTLGHMGVDPACAAGRAMASVPRERFCRLDDIAFSAVDRALALTKDGRSTISALHAYLVAFQALELGVGDHLVDLGAGTGYGAALAAEIVGPGGYVLALEYVPALADQATRLLSGYAHVQVVCGDAHDTSVWRGARKVWCGFAVREVPAAWGEALAEGGRLLLPVDGPKGQVLTRVDKVDGALRLTPLTRVQYVSDRSPPRAGRELTPLVRPSH